MSVLIAEFERLLQGRHFFLGHVLQGEPEQPVIGKLFECAAPVLDSL